MDKRNRFCIAAIGTLVFVSSAMASAQQPPQVQTPVGNPFDLTAAREAMGDRIPTEPGVAALETAALAAFSSGDCKIALDALDKYAKEANGLSNFIARGLKPYYDGSYDDRKAFSGSRLSQLAPLERVANDYKAKRNRAMVMQAECLAKLNDPSKAATMYYQALGLIDIDDTEWWDRARNGLNALLKLTVK